MTSISVIAPRRFDYLPQRIFNKIRAIASQVLGLPPRVRTHDRQVLEQAILPYLTQDRFERILFVGCDWYTQHYPLLFEDREYWTLDNRPEVAPYGSKTHIVGLIQDIGQHFPVDYFDAIVCNGVYGYGLDHKADLEAALSACFERLRSGGLFVFGWNATPERSPVPLDQLQGLQPFERSLFPPLRCQEYLTRTQNRHVFSFYTATKNSSPAQSPQ